MTDSKMLVEVKPIDTKKWHGKTGKESFARPRVIEVLYSTETGNYATGLTDEEAEIYGKKLGVNLSNTFHPTEPHPYWSTKAASIALQNSTMFFDTSKALDFVKVKNLKASKFVANSMKEYNEGLWPDATHVIFDEQEQVEEKATKFALKKRAYEVIPKFTTQDKINIIQVVAERNVKGKSDNFIDVELNDIIENRTADFLKYVEKGGEEIEVRAKVMQLIDAGVLTKDAGAVYYMGDMIAADYEDAVRWFRHPDNARTKVIILDKLNKL